MKKLLLLFLICLFSQAQSQTDFYQQLKEALRLHSPGISLDDKLIAVNFWSTGDELSRQCNKEFDRVYTIYEKAKLKGGLKGLVCVAVNRENLQPEAVIIFGKDGINRLISLKASELPFVPEGLKNMILNSSGEVVYTDLKANEIFSSCNKLITR